MNVISFIKRALQGGAGGAVPVSDDQPLPTKFIDAGGNAVVLTGAFYNMTGVETKVLKEGPGVLFVVGISDPGTSQTLTLYDNTEASGTKIATIPLTDRDRVYGLNFGTGLTAVLSGTADVTIVFA